MNLKPYKLLVSEETANARNELNSSQWITQITTDGWKIPSGYEQNISKPVFTMGLTNASVTENSIITTEFRGLPSTDTWEKIEKEVGTRNNKQIITIYTVSSSEISKEFCSKVHEYFLKALGLEYEREMDTYTRKSPYYPIISREALIFELQVLKAILRKGRELPLYERHKFSPLFNKYGMPILSPEAVSFALEELLRKYKKGAFGFLKITKKFPIKCTKRTRTKTDRQFISQTKRYQKYFEKLAEMRLY